MPPYPKFSHKVPLYLLLALLNGSARSLNCYFLSGHLLFMILSHHGRYPYLKLFRPEDKLFQMSKPYPRPIL